MKVKEVRPTQKVITPKLQIIQKVPKVNVIVRMYVVISQPGEIPMQMACCLLVYYHICFHSCSDYNNKRLVPL